MAGGEMLCGGWPAFGRRQKFVFLAALGCTAVVATPRASAFSLGDHSRITLQAVEEFDECVSDSLSFLERSRILAGVLGEDLNPVRKGLIYSHYFHPFKRIDMLREDSMTSVARSARRIERLKSEETPWRAALGKVAGEAGHLIHHLQDAAVPPHVAPVDHGLSDGFESFELSDAYFGRPLQGEPYFESDCEKLAERASRLSPEDLLSRTAVATLATIGEKFEYYLNGVRGEASWGAAFWKQSRDSSFGRYGFLGNRFGEPVVRLRSSRYDIEKSVFVNFKHRQVRLAVESTKIALYRIFGL